MIPYFGKLKICAVTPQIIMTWQNEIRTITWNT